MEPSELLPPQPPQWPLSQAGHTREELRVHTCLYTNTDIYQASAVSRQRRTPLHNANGSAYAFRNESEHWPSSNRAARLALETTKALHTAVN